MDGPSRTFATVSEARPGFAGSLLALFPGRLVAAPGGHKVQGVGDTFEIDMHQAAYGDYRMANRITRFEQ